MAFPSKNQYTVAVTGAAGQIAYSLIPLIARGDMLGLDRFIKLRLLDLPHATKLLEGLSMELIDCAYPLLREIVVTDDAKVAFADADILILCGAFPRKAGVERKELLEINAKIFEGQGRVAAKVSPSHCRVLVVGNPANINALIFSRFAKDKISSKNITALTRLDHNRALAQCAIKLNKPVETIKNVIIWGNHSVTQVPDVNHATCDLKSVRDFVNEDSYFDNEFISHIQNRGARIIEARGLSSSLSAANAIVMHMRDWINDTPEGVFVSMAVISDENPYGIPPDLFFSFPVKCSKGEWHIVPGLKFSDNIQHLISKSVKELIEERNLI